MNSTGCSRASHSIRRTGRAAGALLAIALLSACTSEPAPEWDGGGVEIDEEVAVDTTPVFTLSPLPAELQDELTIDFSDYLKLPQEQQLAFMSWAVQNRTAFADYFHQVTGYDEDILPTASPTNTAAEITTLSRYTPRIALSLEAANGGVDIEVAQRALHAQYGGGTGIIPARYITGMADRDAALNVGDQGTIHAYGYRFEDIVSESATYENSAGQPTKDIQIEYIDGEGVFEETWSYFTYTNYLGDPDAAWVMMKRTRVQ